MIKIYNKQKGFYISHNGNELNVEPFSTRGKAERFFQLHFNMTYKEYKKTTPKKG